MSRAVGLAGGVRFQLPPRRRMASLAGARRYPQGCPHNAGLACCSAASAAAEEAGRQGVCKAFIGSFVSQQQKHRMPSLEPLSEELVPEQVFVVDVVCVMLHVLSLLRTISCVEHARSLWTDWFHSSGSSRTT